MRTNNEVKLLVCIWVDDILVSGDINEVEKFKYKFMNMFTVVDYGELKNFLGMKFSYSSDGTELHMWGEP